MISFHHAKARGSRDGRLRIAHLCVLKQLSSTCLVSFVATPDTDHKHKFSLTYLTYLSDNLTNTHSTFATRPLLTLRCSTAEWRINTNPISQSFRISQPHGEQASLERYADLTMTGRTTFIPCLSSPGGMWWRDASLSWSLGLVVRPEQQRWSNKKVWKSCGNCSKSQCFWCSHP